MTGHRTVIDAVGGTPLVRLEHVVPDECARVLVKLENQNPTGSMKDRMALAVVDRALESGRLQADGTLVEYTGGSTGTSLAFACTARGLAITVVTSDAFSREKRDHMRALGAQVIELESEGGRTTKELIERMIARAAELAGRPGAFFATGIPRSRPSPSNRRNPPCSPAVRPDPTGSRASARASSPRAGTRIS